MAIVSSLDLNSLDALARTSRRIHDSLIQYRKTLMAATLRCCNEEAPVDPTARHWSFHFRPASTTGRAGSCARDMVKECRRCGHVVCRVRLTGPLRLMNADPRDCWRGLKWPR